MYRTQLIVVMLSVTCMAMPSQLRLRRNTWSSSLKREVEPDSPPQEEMYNLLVNEMYMYLRKSPTSGLLSQDVANFFENVIGKDPHIATNFGTDYIFWGDQNGDHRLNRSELLRAMKIHNVFQYI